jgi:hypothetical protein
MKSMKSTKNTKDYSFRPHSISVALATGGKFSAVQAILAYLPRSGELYVQYP